MIDLDPDNPANHNGPPPRLQTATRFRIYTRLLVLAAHYREAEFTAARGGLNRAAACYHYLSEEAQELAETSRAGISPH